MKDLDTYFVERTDCYWGVRLELIEKTTEGGKVRQNANVMPVKWYERIMMINFETKIHDTTQKMYRRHQRELELRGRLVEMNE